MLQQTTVAAVAPRYRRFVERWPTASSLADAPLEDLLSEWAGLGYYARARNLHKCAKEIVVRFGGAVPYTEEDLRSLPGVGPYTAAAVAAIAFDRAAVVIDGNVVRVVSRLFAIDALMPEAKTAIRTRATEIWPARRAGDFAQALMDLGADICAPKHPDCPRCPLREGCAGYAQGAPSRFPIRREKPARPLMRGAVIAEFDAQGRVLLERRPPKGLLGGMLGLPGGAWSGEAPNASGLPKAAQKAGNVAHVFTHFRLELEVYAVKAPTARKLREAEIWADPETVRLPTVMRKALDRALEAFDRV
jgi:A/G-specific adenine glycosylase